MGPAGFWRRGGGGAAEHGAEAEDEFVGLERFAEVVVGAGFEPGDAVFGRAAGGEQQDGEVLAVLAEGGGEVEAGFAGHHDVEHEGVGLDGAELVAGFGHVGGGGDAEALLGQVAGQQPAEAGVVVDDKDVGVAVGHCGEGSFLSSVARAPPSMMPRMTRRKPSTAGPPASR